MSKLTIEHNLQCQNIDCAHTWVAHTQAVRTIAPSMCPDAAVYLPFSPRSAASRLAASVADQNQRKLGLEEPDHPRAMIHNSS